MLDRQNHSDAEPASQSGSYCATWNLSSAPGRLTIAKNLKCPDSLGGDGQPGRESTVDGDDQPAVTRAGMIIHGAYP